MRKLLVFFVSIFVLLSCTNTFSTDRMLSLEQPPVVYDPPVPERWHINGIEIVFLENQELPLLNATLYFRYGALQAPDLGSAVVSVAGGQMRAGGAGRWSADALDLELEALSAGISSSLGDEYGSVSLHGLASDKEHLFEMFAAIIKEPRFEEERLSLWKGRALEGIRRRIEDPYTVASIAFQQLLYPDTPYGEVLLSDTVKKIKRVDLLRAHRALVRPEKSILTVTGAVTRKEITDLVTAHFGDWNAPEYAFSEIPEVTTKPDPGVYLIELPFEQSTFLMGQLGVPRLSPDHISMIPFNEIFGSGGFSSRLFQSVRVEKGLAYSAYGAIIPGVSRGRNIITAQTKSGSTVPAIKLAIEELERLQNDLVTSEELHETYRALENSFVFKFATPSDLVGRYALLDLLNYPADYDLTFLESLKAVSAEAVRQVARQYWNPEEFVVVLVGNARACKDFEMALQSSDFPLSKLPVRRVKFEEALILKR